MYALCAGDDKQSDLVQRTPPLWYNLLELPGIINRIHRIMKIEEYRFGYIRVGSESYQRDLIILPERVIPDWWREQGHRLSLEDLREVIGCRPDILIIGTGASGVMKVPRDTCDELEDMGIEVVVTRTVEAVLEYNRLIDKGRRVAAALHLTC